MTENQISQLVLDCVEGSYDDTHMESYERWLNHISQVEDANLAPEVLLHDLRISQD